MRKLARKTVIVGICVAVPLTSVGIFAAAKLRPSPYPNASGAFSGIVQSDECAQPIEQGGTLVPIGDVGCYIIVNGKTIYIVHGNILQPTWGKIEGFSTGQNITGKGVTVQAHKRGSGYAISGSSDYVKLTN